MEHLCVQKRNAQQGILGQIGLLISTISNLRNTSVAIFLEPNI